MIPQEAIEEAHAAICEESLEDCLDPDWRGRCVKAIEAAAPFIRAQALMDAADEFSSRLPDGTGNGRAYNSYRVAELLRARAATERGQG